MPKHPVVGLVEKLLIVFSRVAANTVACIHRPTYCISNDMDFCNGVHIVAMACPGQEGPLFTHVSIKLAKLLPFPWDQMLILT